MAFIKLNDLEIEVEDGTNIIEAAREHGIEVPHYCYHPGLTRPANCRNVHCGTPCLLSACGQGCSGPLNSQPVAQPRCVPLLQTENWMGNMTLLSGPIRRV